MRPGTFALSLLSVPLNVHVLEALEEAPRSLRDLRRSVGAPPPTTLRKQLRVMEDLEVVTRRRQSEFPGAVEYELGPAGGELLDVGRLLQAWLAECPEGPLTLGSGIAKNALKALVEGWNAKIIRAVAARPLSLTDLSRLITSLNYPALERRVSALRLCGLIEPQPGEKRSTPYAPSPWLRRACGSLMAAAQWERRYAAAEGSGEVFDFEGALLLAAPGIPLPEDAGGRCRLGVEVRNGEGEWDWIGVQLQIMEGEVLSCTARPKGKAEAFVSGAPSAWVTTLRSGRPEDLDLSGDNHLASVVVEGLHRQLSTLRQLA